MTAGTVSRRSRALLTVVLALAALLVGVAPAQAHDTLNGSAPAAGAQVDQLPGQIVLTFDEPALALGSQIIVTGPSGPVQEGVPQLVDTQVRQPVRGGPAGRYAVSWRVTSADGHPVSGTFEFTTARANSAAAETAAPATNPPVVAAAPASRGGLPVWLFLLVGALVVVGGLGWAANRAARRRTQNAG